MTTLPGFEDLATTLTHFGAMAFVVFFCACFLYALASTLWGKG